MILIVLLGGSTGVACVVGAVTALTQGLDVASGHRAHRADRGDRRRDPPVDLRPPDVLGRGADVDVGGAAAGQPRPPGRDHALHPDDRPRQVAGDAASSSRCWRSGRDCWDSPWPWPSRPRRRSRRDSPARYYEELSDGAVLFGAGLLVATILVHGALIASVGLALAVWISAAEPGDRPERGVRRDGGRRLADPRRGHARMGVGSGLACLSPVVAAVSLVGIVVDRLRFRDRDPLVDHVLGHRVPGAGPGALVADGADLRRLLRPHPRPTAAARRCSPTSSWSWPAWSASAACSAGSRPGSRGLGTSCPRRTTECRLASSWSPSASFCWPRWPRRRCLRRRRRRPSARVSAAAISGRKSFAIRWWEAFRLVLLLAIGPALVALALATAPMAFRVATKVKPLPGGGSVTIETNPLGDTYVTTTDASGRVTDRVATDAEIAAGRAGPADPYPRRLAADRRPGDRHGPGPRGGVRQPGRGAGGLDPAAGLGDRRERRPGPLRDGGLADRLSPHFLDRGYPRWGLAVASVLRAYRGLLFHRDRSAVIAIMSGWVGYWDVILILWAAIISGLAIRTVGRRSRGGPAAKTDSFLFGLKPMTVTGSQGESP